MYDLSSCDRSVSIAIAIIQNDKNNGVEAKGRQQKLAWKGEAGESCDEEAWRELEMWALELHFCSCTFYDVS